MVQGPILVTGASGQVGGAVAKLAAAKGIAMSAPNRAALDLTNEAHIMAAVAGQPWAAIINCAAYTAVDKAEAEPDVAQAINAVAPGIWARESARLGIPLIHVSTDYVFDGRKPEPYVEADRVNPLGVYGRTKEAGESAIRAAHPNHAIIRTAWVVSATGANFINTMLRLGAERAELRVVDDQWGCPSNADDIADALITVAASLGDRAGTWHFVNSGEATWHALAGHVFAQTKRHGLPTPLLTPIPTADYPTPAKRPANSRLDTRAIQSDFDIQPRSWQEAVDAVLAERLTS
jgi:dTDP-4-dehydrorhamnose reductase